MSLSVCDTQAVTTLSHHYPSSGPLLKGPLAMKSVKVAVALLTGWRTLEVVRRMPMVRSMGR